MPNPLNLLFIADCRSPTARNWISPFIDAGHEVHVITTFPAGEIPGSGSHTLIPIGMSDVDDSGSRERGRTALLRRWTTPAMRSLIRRWLSAVTLTSAADRVNRRILQLRPDLVHALRIPFEGIVAARGMPKDYELKMGGLGKIPLVVSVWGNDFTLHAPANRWMEKQTRTTLAACAGLLADSQNDLKLAREWGLPRERPVRQLPGGGGVDPAVFYPPDNPGGNPVVVNPRGIRTYVHTQAFLQAVPRVLEKAPGTRFRCTGIAGHPQETGFQALLERSGAAGAVDFLPGLPHHEMGDFFRAAQVIVSPTSHDGTPNSLLEAMACGCFPVAGDIPSVREWIGDGENGLLIDPEDPNAIAAAVLEALNRPDLRAKAADINRTLVQTRALRSAVTAAAEKFYRSLSG